MIIGFDYASVDSNPSPNFATAAQAIRAAGSTPGFCIFRGAWGTWKDPIPNRDWKLARAAGLTCGAYLYLRTSPQIYMRQSPEDQVKAFADSVGPLTDRDFAPTLDVEDRSETAELGLELVHRAWVAMRDIYRTPPMIYTSYRVWHEQLHDLPAGDMIDSPLWLAKPWPWVVKSKAQLGSAPFASGALDPKIPVPWGPHNWWIHQYQGDAYPMAGFVHTVDLNRFRVMKRNESGHRVFWVQRRLTSSLPRTLTGVYDDATEQLVRAFQASRGLVADGIIGPKTFAALSWVAPAAEAEPSKPCAA